ncbi:preprotein translocase subunit SecY [Candidatus Uhrbacteria bacterium RIFCSPHIGHO2_01_FULL_63_20]|uniref:Protein translocase subunit SecY n=1 Tax=Candidatus Uhrbacteria bacterium RIFCSPHIGHO2_01_FULL_63_20 TaxID=1802385 RepID=A0A1F7TMI3_9BACT|nr:MAG: preprotein translocase subunit SecY [Candidatus Uhrbacteria bacterium RIFCSPHIGHO2_01_FULL_63_20]
MIPIRRIWKSPEVRNGLLFMIAMLVVFRLAAHVPVPGVDRAVIEGIAGGNQLFGLLNLFSGGTFENFSVVALGVGPYITASIIFQLLGMIVPKMEEMQKEEQGRARINRWTRALTVPLAFLQGYSLILLFGSQASGQAVFTDGSLFTMLLAMASMTAGTIFLMWLGELISERQMGNGISILIFAGITAGLPSYLSQAFSVFDRSQILTILLFALLVVVTIATIVVMNEAVRKIPVQYARQIRGSRLAGAVASFLPLKLNLGGVIPIIFAISIILFPTTLAQFFVNATTPAVREAAQWVVRMFQDQNVYGAVFFVMVFLFTFFYASVIFHPDRVAENLQKQGGFIPGIRPGEPTAQYLGWVSNRLLLVGATFLSLIAVLPTLVQQVSGNASLVIGGTSVLIVVSVVIDTVKQIEAQLTMREYEM